MEDILSSCTEKLYEIINRLQPGSRRFELRSCKVLKVEQI
jgi:hypothetical protein